MDPPRDGPPRPGHQSQLNSYRSQRARAGFRNPTFARRCVLPLAQFRQFAVLVVAWTFADLAGRSMRWAGSATVGVYGSVVVVLIMLLCSGSVELAGNRTAWRATHPKGTGKAHGLLAWL